MRPKSIILFERLYLASIAVTAINTWLTYDRTLGQMERDPTLGALGWGAGMFMAVLAVSLLVSLLLYYLVAYRANVIAKWVLVCIHRVWIARRAGCLRDIGRCRTGYCVAAEPAGAGGRCHAVPARCAGLVR